MAKKLTRIVAFALFLIMLVGAFSTSILAAPGNGRHDHGDDDDHDGGWFWPGWGGGSVSGVTLAWCYDSASTNGDHESDLGLASVKYNGADWAHGASVALSKEESGEIVVTPAEGYRVVSIDMLCTNTDNSWVPYRCLTYNEGASYSASPVAGSTNISVSDFTVDSACNHASRSTLYYVMVTVEKIPNTPTTPPTDPEDPEDPKDPEEPVTPPAPVYYSVTYLPGEGTGESYSDGELSFTEEYTVDANTFFAPVGKAFAGWLVTECEDTAPLYDLSGNTYTAGDKFVMPAGDVTLTAQWKSTGVTPPAPTTTPEPETTKAPETTPEPETTKAPETIPEPETTKAPETTPEPETTKAPETTPEPETTKAPETTPEPETTKAPETIPAPETTKAPETIPTPETTKAPETTRKPIVVIIVEHTTAPETTPEPETTPAPVETTPAPIETTTPEPETTAPEELEEIEDDPTPLTDLPKTGDLSVLWYAGLAISGVTLIATSRKKKED